MTNYDELISLINATVPSAMEQMSLPGFAIALVDGGGTVWEGGFGTTIAGATDAPAVGAHTPFALMSISKTYTGFALMVAVSRGLISLDDPVTKFMPSFTIRSRFEGFDPSTITVRHLMAHRAGLLHEAPVGNNFGVWHCTLAEHAASIQETWLKVPVGQEYSYSNLGIDLAGYVLELATGQPFEEFVRDNVFQPLGMTDSTFAQSVALAHPGLAWGHTAKGPITPQPVPMGPAGGMFSSVADMARFVSCCMAGGVSREGDRILPEALLAEMFTPQFASDGNGKPAKTGYGLGASVQELTGEALFDHGGGGFGYQTVQRWLPSSGLGVVILTNSSTHPGRHYGLADLVLSLAKSVKAGDLGPATSDWAAYSGVYSAPLYNDTVTRAVYQLHGHLYLDEGRLQPYQPVSGLFFTQSGEYVQFGDGSMVASGVRYAKQS